MPMRFLRRLVHRRTPTLAPREAWVVLIGNGGREVSARRPAVFQASCSPHEFTTDSPLDMGAIETRSVTHVRVIDADGTVTDVPIR